MRQTDSTAPHGAAQHSQTGRRQEADREQEAGDRKQIGVVASPFWRTHGESAQ